MSAPDAWSPPSEPPPDDAPRRGMTAHRVSPERRAEVVRQVTRRHVRLAAVALLLVTLVMVPSLLLDGLEAALLGLPCVLTLAAAALVGVRALYRQNVALAADTVLWSDDHGIVLRRSGLPDLWVRRSEVAAVRSEGGRVVVQREDGATVWFDGDLGGADALLAKVTSWAPEHPAPPVVATALPVRWKLVVFASIAAYVVHMISLDPIVATITAIPATVGLVWFLALRLRDENLPMSARLVALMSVFPLFGIVGKIVVVWTMPLP